MSILSERVAFLRGMAEGLNLKNDTPEQKLIQKLIETLDLFAVEMDGLKDEVEELNEYVEDIEEDLTDLEDDIYGDEDDDDEDDDEEGCCCGHHHHHHDGEDEDEEDDVVEYECPHCGYETRFDVADFDLEEDYRCPSCHQPLFPESDDEDERDENDQDDAKNEDKE